MSDRRATIAGLKSYAALLLLCIIFACLSPIFLTFQNLSNILLASSTLGLLAIAAAFVIGSAGLDLSVGSLMAFSSCLSAVLMVEFSMGWPMAIIVCLLGGLSIGLLNGVLAAVAAIPAFIVTLGTLSLVRGLAYIMTDGLPVYGLPEPLVFIGQGLILGLPVPIWVFVSTGLAAHIVMTRTRFGVYTLTIGDNESSVRSAGVDLTRHKIKLYMLSGLLAALAGLIFMGRVNAADPSAGIMYELGAITAAILGGTHLFGGRASILGAMVGALIIGVLQNGLTLLAVPSYYQQVALGLVLILAVLLDRLLDREVATDA